MTDLSTLTKHYNGFTITVREDSFRFQLDGGDIGKEPRCYESFDAAKAAVDKIVATQTKTQRIKLNLPVYDQNGEEKVVTGIHAGHGQALGAPFTKRSKDRSTSLSFLR